MGGLEGIGGWEGVGSCRRVNLFGLEEQCYAFTAREAKIAVRSTFVPNAILLMPSRAIKCTLVV